MNPGAFISAFKAAAIAYLHVVFAAAVFFGLDWSAEKDMAVIAVIDGGLGLFFMALAAYEKWTTPTTG